MSRDPYHFHSTADHVYNYYRTPSWAAAGANAAPPTAAAEAGSNYSYPQYAPYPHTAPAHAPFPGPLIVPRRKKATPAQLKILTDEFARGLYPSTRRRKELAKQLGIPPRSVQIWFQNQRQMGRKQADEPQIPCIRTPSFGQFGRSASSGSEGEVRGEGGSEERVPVERGRERESRGPGPSATP
ncbi:hypothetical protein B0H21DRAFT_712378 [Amylocystis lapponica]|nr:hypothetical protein B0H21DRAFT_712378 [Amylocystis lapponica]